MEKLDVKDQGLQEDKNIAKILMCLMMTFIFSGAYLLIYLYYTYITR